MSFAAGPGVDVQTLLASNAHEIKNLVGQLTLALDRLALDGEPARGVRLLARRIGDRMVQLLTLYKLQGERLSPRIESNFPADFIDELALEARSLAAGRVAVESVPTRAEDFWFFDRELAQMAMLNALHNALAYAREKIVLSASVREGYLVLGVEDDGGGFPEQVLASQSQAFVGAGCNGTGLGLYFADVVAKAHVNRGREGRLVLANRAPNRGTSFELWLP